ncbi:hypothetical protein [Paracoccus sp. PAR01]|uniref:hypothetical protein n=1 Tax=Paracoccus sp. PAR01 TaxID=2769282 RepID=UPI0017872000|nr:hypothetical protein [Paracoccus sp. PAR01]MBD9526667.1 hypothetical protein [Paracoccus sp. PAR01]
MKRTQLSGVELDRKTFGDDYGEPLKIKRMLKLANVIASIANLFIRNDAVRYRVAIDDQKSDLQFLKGHYRRTDGHHLPPWPKVSATDFAI